jgi:putative membrane protein insertion efficiency factor
MSSQHAHGEVDDDRPRNPLTLAVIGLVRIYQAVVSPWLPPTCRYYPSCSSYAVTALRRHGVFKGSALATWRVLRCNPWSLGGVDHVPPRGRWRTEPPAEESSGPTAGGKARTLGPDTRGARRAAPQDH